MEDGECKYPAHGKRLALLWPSCGMHATAHRVAGDVAK